MMKTQGSGDVVLAEDSEQEDAGSPSLHIQEDSDDKTFLEDTDDARTTVSEVRERKVPDGGWGWMVVAGSTLTHLLLVGMARSFGVLYVLLLLYFNSSNAATAWVTAIFNMVRTLNGRSNKHVQYMTSVYLNKCDTEYPVHVHIKSILFVCVSLAPVSSMMCERWGSRVTAVSGAFLSCIGFSLSAFVSNLYVVYFTFGLIGGKQKNIMFSPMLNSL